MCHPSLPYPRYCSILPLNPTEIDPQLHTTPLHLISTDVTWQIRDPSARNLGTAALILSAQYEEPDWSPKPTMSCTPQTSKVEMRYSFLAVWSLQDTFHLVTPTQLLMLNLSSMCAVLSWATPVLYV